MLIRVPGACGEKYWDISGCPVVWRCFGLRTFIRVGGRRRSFIRMQGLVSRAVRGDMRWFGSRAV
jgi:hypothetical protein